MLSYFIYTIISLGCTYTVYILLLRNQKTFQFNRFFLICSILLCLAAPFLEIELFNSVPSLSEIPAKVYTESVEVSQESKNESYETVEMASETQKSPFYYLYLSISCFLMFRFLRNLIKIHRLTRANYLRFGKLKLIKSSDSDVVSSFFNYVFINKNHVLTNEEYESVMRHEAVHSQQLHTIDIIISELLICVLWFNPFVWLYRKAILQNHEYIADDISVLSGISIEDYSSVIINLGHKEYRVPLTSGFNFIQIKNRINMLHQSKSSVLKRSLKIFLVILLTTGIFVFSSYKNLEDPLIVVIDAGHGGHDYGSQNEKDIVLNISKELSKLSDEKVKIITSRNADDFFTLDERAKFVNSQNADVFISLHCNTSEDKSINGVEAFVNNKTDSDMLSFAVGWLLIDQQIENNIVNKGDLKKASLYILKNIECPSVMLELGFLSNAEDRKRLNNELHQQDIARALYAALLKFRDRKNNLNVLIETKN